MKENLQKALPMLFVVLMLFLTAMQFQGNYHLYG